MDALRPAQEWWARVQSWRSPLLSSSVAAFHVLLVTWPSRVLAALLLAAALKLWIYRVRAMHGHGHAAAPGGQFRHLQLRSAVEMMLGRQTAREAMQTLQADVPNEG